MKKEVGAGGKICEGSVDKFEIVKHTPLILEIRDGRLQLEQLQYP